MLSAPAPTVLLDQHEMTLKPRRPMMNFMTGSDMAAAILDRSERQNDSRYSVICAGVGG